MLICECMLIIRISKILVGLSLKPCFFGYDWLY